MVSLKPSSDKPAPKAPTISITTLENPHSAHSEVALTTPMTKILSRFRSQNLKNLKNVKNSKNPEFFRTYKKFPKEESKFTEEDKSQHWDDNSELDYGYGETTKQETLPTPPSLSSLMYRVRDQDSLNSQSFLRSSKKGKKIKRKWIKRSKKAATDDGLDHLTLE